MAERKMWVVRAGEKARLFDDFQKKSIIAIGWANRTDLSTFSSAAEIKRIYKETHPDEKPGQINISAGQESQAIPARLYDSKYSARQPLAQTILEAL